MIALLLSLALLAQDVDVPGPVPQFERRVLDDRVAIGYGLAIGRVDADEKPDVILADQRQFVWYRNGDWKRFVLAENLTAHDDVCVAARDLDGDGLVEIAVGGQWNPGDTLRSGSVHWLQRPEDPTQRWPAVALPCDPTVHRMHWVRVEDARFQLAVLPLHGRGNANAEGETVRLLLYDLPRRPDREPWRLHAVDTGMHLTHNFDVVERSRGARGSAEGLIVAGREDLKVLWDDRGWQVEPVADRLGSSSFRGAGEVRRFAHSTATLATIEPFHGHELVVYEPLALHGDLARRVLADDLAEGHALVCADFLGLGQDQIAVGWRRKNAAGQVGIRLYVRRDGPWTMHPIDDVTACEDLKAADLDGDGDLDLVAAGRASHDLVVFWNQRLRPR